MTPEIEALCEAIRLLPRKARSRLRALLTNDLIYADLSGDGVRDVFAELDRRDAEKRADTPTVVTARPVATSSS